MKKTLFTIVFSLFALGRAVSQNTLIDSPEGQQIILGEHKRFTIFSDDIISEGDPLCVYLDSSTLEDKGYNLMEWYYLERVDKHYIEIRKSSGKLRLPAYILDDEKNSIISVPVSGIGKAKGILAAHGTRILITVSGDTAITAELSKK